RIGPAARCRPRHTGRYAPHGLSADNAAPAPARARVPSTQCLPPGRAARLRPAPADRSRAPGPVFSPSQIPLFCLVWGDAAPKKQKVVNFAIRAVLLRDICGIIHSIALCDSVLRLVPERF